MGCVKNKKCCDRKCNDEQCSDINIYDLLDSILIAESKISSLSEDLLRSVLYGYSCKTDGIESKDFLSLSKLRHSLLRYLRSILENNKPCLCKDEVSLLMQTVKDIGISCSVSNDGISRDYSNFDTWLLTNSSCVGVYEWEESLYRALPKVGIFVKDVKSICDISYTINSIDKKCEFLSAITVYSKACKEGLKPQISANSKNCKLEYESLKKEHNCSLTFTSYKKIVDCNLSTDVIKTIYNCGLSIEYDSKDKCPIININSNSNLKLCTFDANILSSDVNKNLLEKYLGKSISESLIDSLSESYVNCDLK